MKLITRYVLFEVITVFVLTLLSITLLMVLVGIIREAIREGMGLGPVMRMIPFALPEALQFSVPATILLAVCTVYGRMSADNEIVALKSMGINPWVVFIPGLVLSFALSILAVQLSDIAATWGREGMCRVAMESLEQIVYGVLRVQKSYSTRRLSICVKSVQDHLLIQPYIAIYSENDQPITISAQSAELYADAAKGLLRMTLTKASVMQGVYSYQFNAPHEFVIPLTDVHRKGPQVRRAADFALHQINGELRQETVHFAELREAMATQAAFDMAMWRLEQVGAAGQHEQLVQLHTSRSRVQRLKVEPWRRWSNGFSCFCFVLVGAPLAVKLRTTNYFTTFAACFLPILLIYYPLMTLSADHAKDGLMPSCSVWSGNLILAVIGSMLLRHVIRR
ncbi:MAG: LptF/LptG family permease [Pirellulales bacterium]